MSSSREVWAIIPARGGSKGIPRKNLALLGGRPLIAYSIDAARRRARTIVSTDDEEIARVARSCGAEVPFLRPADLATDTASVRDAIMHTIDRLVEEEGSAPWAVVVLFTTSPFRPVGVVDDIVERLRDSWLAITVFPHEGAVKSLGVATAFRYSPKGTRPWEGARPQGLNAYVPVTNPSALVDIDEPADLELAERVISGEDVEIEARFAPETLWRPLRVLDHAFRPSVEASFRAPAPGTWTWARAWKGHRVVALSACEGCAFEGVDPQFAPVMRRGTITWPARGDAIEYWNVTPDAPERAQAWFPVEGPWTYDPNADLRVRHGRAIQNRQEYACRPK